MAKRKIKIISDEHIRVALANHLSALSIIDDNDRIVAYKKVPEGIEVTVEKFKDGND